MKVKDCMCDDVCCVKPNAKVQEVAKLMAQNHIGCVPVCDNNDCICGIVTDRDVLLRCVACDKDIHQTPVSDIMSCNVYTCQENDEMSNAESKMGQQQIRRLPVCDNQNRIVGILTMGDIAQNNQQLGQNQVCTTFENICGCNNKNNS
jgi:predicted transcriptional regulator